MSCLLIVHSSTAVSKFKRMNTSGRGALLFIFVTVSLDAIGIGIILPVLPDLLQTVVGSDLATAARWGGVLAASYAFMQFLFGPLLGSLSDKLGRRPVLLVGLFLLAVDYAIMSIAQSLVLLIAARLLAGMVGATHITAKAYIADISPPEKRAANFGIVGAAFGIGFIFGPVIGGLLGEWNVRAPFALASVIALVNCAYGFFVLPESLLPAKRRAFSWANANPVSGLLLIKRFKHLRWLFVAFFIFGISHFVFAAVWTYWGAEVLDWSSSDIGWSLAAVGIGFAVVQGWLIRRLIPVWGESRTAVAGLCATALALCLLSFTTSAVVVYMIIPFIAFGAVVTPAFESLLSKQIPADEQGLLQGVNGGLTAVAMIISPLMMTYLFFTFSKTGEASRWYFPGAPYLLAGLLTLAAIVAFRLSVIEAGQSAEGTS